MRSERWHGGIAAIITTIAMVAGCGKQGADGTKASASAIRVAATAAPAASTTASGKAAAEEAADAKDGFPPSMRGAWWKDYKPADSNEKGGSKGKEEWKKLNVGAKFLTVTGGFSEDPLRLDVHCDEPNRCTVSNQFAEGSAELDGADVLVLKVKLKPSVESEFNEAYSDWLVNKKGKPTEEQQRLTVELSKHFGEQLKLRPLLLDISGAWDRKDPRASGKTKE